MQLNDTQQEAIEYNEGPLCIYAGPGTGKTLVLQKKYEHIIKETGIEPHNILGLTFTNSAANELVNRVHRSIGVNKHAVQISTFHSHCLRIIERNPEECGLKKGFQYLTPERQEKLIFKILQELAIPWNQKYLPAIRETLSRAKKEQQWQEQNTSYAQKIAREIYTVYQHYLMTNNQIDLDDMVVKANRMLESHPDILDRYREQYKYILVDECQDMDYTQYIFLALMECDNTTIVGDDDQCIYEFTGSSLKYIKEFVDEFKAKTITLDRNYRSTKNILKVGSELISNNKDRIGKTIKTDNHHGVKMKVLTSPDEMTEAKNIAKLVQNKEDCAILYRQNKQAQPIEQAFQAMGIPYKVVGGTGFYQRKEIKDALAIIRITKENDPVSFQRVMMMLSGIGSKTITRLMEHADATNLSYIDACNTELSWLNQGQRDILKHFYDAYQSTDYDSTIEHVTTLISIFIPTITNHAALDRLDKLLDNLKRWKGTLEQFIEHMGHLETSPKTVKLLTIHKSKGMEFGTVIISGYEQGILPHQSTVYDMVDVSIEEERRLAYVGITRAKQEIILSYVKYRKLYNERLQQLPSQFLGEISEGNKEYL